MPMKSPKPRCSLLRMTAVSLRASNFTSMAAWPKSNASRWLLHFQFGSNCRGASRLLPGALHFGLVFSRFGGVPELGGRLGCELIRRGLASLAFFIAFDLGEDLLRIIAPVC